MIGIIRPSRVAVSSWSLNHADHCARLVPVVTKSPPWAKARMSSFLPMSSERNRFTRLRPWMSVRESPPKTMLNGRSSAGAVTNRNSGERDLPLAMVK
jgi:hypothetical protein